jgi:hypothetical protein
LEEIRLNTKKLVTVALLAMSFTLLGLPQFANAAIPPDDNALWFEPDTVYVDSASPIGYKFNVTLWAVTVNQTKGWQIRLNYSNTYLNYSRAGLTAGGKSEFYEDYMTFAVQPSVAVGATTNRLDYGEAAPGPPINPDFPAPGNGSLCWIEFEVIATLPGGYTEIPLDISYAYASADPPFTYLYYWNDDKRPLTVYNGLVVIPELSSILMLVLLFAFAVPITLQARKRNR